MTGNSDSSPPFWPAVCLGVVCLAYIGMGLYFGDVLPERVASHFNLFGEADGWTSRGELMGTFWISGGVILITILVPGYVIAALPVSMINLPNKEYWLSEERKDQTFNWWKKHMLWFGVAIMSLFTYIFYETFNYNMTEEGMPISVLFPVIIFLVFVVAWIVQMFRYFRLPDNA